VIATVGTLAETVESAGLQAPVMLIIGRVVELAAKLDWFQPQNQETTDDRMARFRG
jgi:uroporphyrin-III C-methyltransferase/precorrin-2 dehydrogenase/sirohydrochlorin ferrochelatase/uroporphyrin-III C-methyltransferase